MHYFRENPTVQVQNFSLLLNDENKTNIVAIIASEGNVMEVLVGHRVCEDSVHFIKERLGASQPTTYYFYIKSRGFAKQ